MLRVGLTQNSFYYSNEIPCHTTGGQQTKQTKNPSRTTSQEKAVNLKYCWGVVTHTYFLGS